MSEGQFESDKALHEVLPSFCPKPYALGKYKAAGPANYFILAEFRDIGQQPPEPARFTARLAELHKKSVSPTGKFGFHVKSCHGKAPQLTDTWEESWEVSYYKQLKHVFDMDKSKQRHLPEFDFCAQLVLDKCIPRLLRPLQSDGRSIKPCLVHGNIWDENTATDMRSGEPFVFDGSAFYAHNEFEMGNWRTPRHRLSSKTYIRGYKRHFPASEPGRCSLPFVSLSSIATDCPITEEDWDSRNLLYSLRPNLTAAWLIPGSNYREK
jgi:fructosamine-3-kinase